MFHEHHVFSQMACICHFIFFMSCQEPPMGTSGMGSFPVQSGDSAAHHPIILKEVDELLSKGVI